MANLLAELTDSFARGLRAEMKAPRTVKLYSMCVRLFSEWLTATGHPTTLDQLNRDLIREWLAHLAEDREASTVRTRFKGLHRFCGWLVAEGELDTSPMVGMSPPEPSAKPVPVLDDDELTALLKACAGRTFADRRDEAILRVLLDAGIRVSELCGLTVADVDLDREMAMVTGKGTRSARSTSGPGRSGRSTGTYANAAATGGRTSTPYS